MAWRGLAGFGLGVSLPRSVLPVPLLTYPENLLDLDSGECQNSHSARLSMRRLVQTNQHWTHAPPTFVHTTVIYEEDGRLFIAHVEKRIGLNNPISVDEVAALCGREIYINLIWPVYDRALTIAVDHDQTLFLKKPNIIDVALKDSDIIKTGILMEARLCEDIRRSPHPNVVDYKGCLVEDNKIKGLLLKRYCETLYDRVNRSHDMNKILSELTSGINHLHSIGIVHGDLQPANIMFDNDDNVVIIDLDSGHKTGEVLATGDKKGSTFFTKEATVAFPENDHYSMARIKDFLEGGMQKIIDQNQMFGHK